MKFEKRATLVLLSSLVFTGVLSIGLCVGWFHKNNSIDVDQLTGSVLKKYFEDGDGSEANPFEIARPKQYENFVRLHYEMEGFADKKFYFELGHVWKNADGTYKFSDGDGNPITTPVFADYSDDGILNSSSYSLSLNMNSMRSMPPIGSDQLPFNAKLEGNGLTITKFKVVGTGYSDIGIFGYVGAEGTVSNVYFSDFSIDTTTGAYPEVLEGNPSRNHDHDDENVFMGYIAGHIQDAQAFTNVYVNRCTLKGDSQNAKTINNYGYYGHAEVDGLGGMTGVGNDYQFDLNAAAFYSYFSGAYNTIKERNLILRNTEESGIVKYDSEGNIITGQHKEMSGLKLQDAVSPATFRLGNIFTVSSDAYQLNGRVPSSTTVPDRNYSISTTGQRGYPMGYSNHYYDVVAKQGSTNIVPSSSDAQGIIIRNSSLEELVAEQNGGSLTGSYFYYNKTARDNRPVGWRYMNANARIATASDTGSLTINVNSFSFKAGDVGAVLTMRSVSSASGKLYFDDREEDLTVSATYRSNAATVTVSPKTLTGIRYGKHRISVVLDITWKSYTYTYNTRFAFGESYSNRSVTQSEFDFLSYGANTFTFNQYVGYNAENSISSTQIAFDNSQTVVYTTSSHVDLPLFGAETTCVNGVYSSVPISSSHTTTMTDTTMTFELSNGRWYAHHTIYEEQRDQEPTDQFIGDAEQIVDSGYNSNCLDIVGGGVKFTSFSLLGNKIDLISIPSEGSGTAVTVPAIQNSDIGKTFYAPSMCPNSIVLYLKNTSNARDNRDDKLGSIEFEYATAESISSNLVSLFGINIAKPVFKKGGGSGNTIALDQYGTLGDGSGALTLKYSLPELLESHVKQMSYCALDKDGKILGKFNMDGTPSTGFSGANESNLTKIDKYVICIGCFSTQSSSTECWVTDVKFNYKAEAGYGGTFGSVGYRDASDTIDTTILTYYLVFDAGNNQYSILVYFDKNTMAYHIIASASAEVELRVYNYYPDQYSLYISSTGNQNDEVQYSGSVARVTLGT